MIPLSNFHVLSKNGTTIHLLGTVNGLISEREKVITAFYEMAPDLIALGVSEEYLETLQHPPKVSAEDVIGEFDEISGLESIYLKKLADYGEVGLPPAELVAAVELGADEHVSVAAFDMNEDECVRAYTGSLSKWPIVISTFFAPFKIRRIRKRNFKAETAEDFVKEFDAVRQKIRGFKRLEQQRERIMAERLIKLSQNHKSVLAIVEAQRLNGLFSALQAVQL